MKTWITAAVLLTGLIMLQLGCSKKPNKVFTSAIVKVNFDGKGNQVHTAGEIKDPADINMLLTYFPGFLEGKSNYNSGGWMASVDITFVRADGSTAHLKTDYDLWNEGAGDHPVDGDFRAYINANFLNTK